MFPHASIRNVKRHYARNSSFFFLFFPDLLAPDNQFISFPRKDEWMLENSQWQCCEMPSFSCRIKRSLSLTLSSDCSSQWLMAKWLIVSHSSKIGQCIENLRNITRFHLFSPRCQLSDAFPSAIATCLWIVATAFISRIDKTQMTWTTTEKDPDVTSSTLLHGVISHVLPSLISSLFCS